MDESDHDEGGGLGFTLPLVLSIVLAGVAWSYAAFGESLSAPRTPARMYLLANQLPENTESPGSEVEPIETASVDPASVACNIEVCTLSYRSFDPSDCTYQPYEGPRKLCTRR